MVGQKRKCDNIENIENIENPIKKCKSNAGSVITSHEPCNKKSCEKCSHNQMAYFRHFSLCIIVDCQICNNYAILRNKHKKMCKDNSPNCNICHICRTNRKNQYKHSLGCVSLTCKVKYCIKRRKRIEKSRQACSAMPIPQWRIDQARRIANRQMRIEREKEQEAESEREKADAEFSKQVFAVHNAIVSKILGVRIADSAADITNCNIRNYPSHPPCKRDNEEYGYGDFYVDLDNLGLGLDLDNLSDM
jgi:hypothetical protein